MSMPSVTLGAFHGKMEPMLVLPALPSSRRPTSMPFITRQLGLVHISNGRQTDQILLLKLDAKLLDALVTIVLEIAI